ncbi:hypothetical protein GCM10027160_18620 [Streptomyces calidiresistens]
MDGARHIAAKTAARTLRIPVSEASIEASVPCRVETGRPPCGSGRVGTPPAFPLPSLPGARDPRERAVRAVGGIPRRDAR